ncbi:hypothetical protein ACI79G_05295 [Geodermatophilus sp. SYSU D00779]
MAGDPLLLLHVTGLLVASTGDPVWWVLPALIGQAPIAVAERRLHGAAHAPAAT